MVEYISSQLVPSRHKSWELNLRKYRDWKASIYYLIYFSFYGFCVHFVQAELMRKELKTKEVKDIPVLA